MKDKKIKNPQQYYRYSAELDAFILAAQTDSLRPACEVLRIHAGDLAWTKSSGSFLYRINLGEDIGDAIEMTRARTTVGAVAFVRSLWPLIQSLMTKMAGKYGEVHDPSKDEDWHPMMAALAGVNLAREKGFSRLAGVNLQDIIPLLIDGLSGFLATEAIDLRSRQLASLGMSESAYDDMVRCLERLESHCVAIARVAFARHSLHPELGLSATGGFRVTALDESAHTVEILRLGRTLDTLKRGEDKALPVFMAAMINRQLLGEEAHACARYGERDRPEFDVVIPKLGVGMEIKLYQGRGVMTPDRVATAAQELSRQLKNYLEFGFRRIYYVCNLEHGIAREVLNTALEHIEKPEGVKVKAIGGSIADIVELCEGLAGKLAKRAGEAHERMIRAAFERARGQEQPAGAATDMVEISEDATEESPARRASSGASNGHGDSTAPDTSQSRKRMTPSRRRRRAAPDPTN